VPVEAVVLDIDGTLIESNYQHALAWCRAFRRHGIVLPAWCVHRALGLGGDKLVPALAGEKVDKGKGVMTGGWSNQELREAGAAAVFESVDELRRRLDETLLG
jgi:beta-phosphoglucomutase-like phosphatase (HAD superfamily)